MIWTYLKGTSISFCKSRFVDIVQDIVQDNTIEPLIELDLGIINKLTSGISYVDKSTLPLRIF